MAKFSFNGMDEIAASFEQLAHLSDDEKVSILMPSAQLLLQRQREKIASLFKRRTGDLENSLAITQQQNDGNPSLFIAPAGKHRGSSTGKRKGKRRSNGKYSGTNAEVAYILEYGSPRIAATHWMETANEEAAEEVTASQQDAWNELVTKKGL